MRALLHKQNDLSIASATFYLLGGLISLLQLTVLRTPDNPGLSILPVVVVVSFGLCVLFLALGKRVNLKFALALMCVAALFTLAYVPVSPTMVRTMNLGLLFYTSSLYMIWFAPIRFARIFNLVWALTFIIVVLIRWGFVVNMVNFLVTWALTAVVLGELIGLFKRRLEASATLDPLCGIWNKRGFHMLLNKAMAQLNRGGPRFTVAFIDLDNFKAINDSGGHAAGDRTLIEFARAIDSRVRPQDTFARLGGDEFVLLLRDTTILGAERALARLHEEVTSVSWSYGLAEASAGEPTESLVSRADALMFEHKRGRKADLS